jgi:hypothetical protein
VRDQTRKRASFVWRCLMNTVDEVGALSQRNRIVGIAVLGSAFGLSLLVVGVAFVGIFAFRTAVPGIVATVIVILAIFIEGEGGGLTAEGGCATLLWRRRSGVRDLALTFTHASGFARMTRPQSS